MTVTEHAAEQPSTVATSSGDAAGARGRSATDLLKIVGPPLLVFVGFVAAWYLYSAVVGETERKISSPYPHAVVQEVFGNGDNLSELLEATWVSTKVATTGLAIAGALGVLFAVLMSQARWVERSFYPYAILIQTVPILALVPLINLRFGFGFQARVIVCVVISLFPIITNTLFGLKAIERGHDDLFRLHSAGRLTRLGKLNFPASLPAMLTGFQISAGLAVIGAIVGDFFFGRGEKGLGIRIREYNAFLETEMLIGGIFFSALLGIVMFQIFGALRHFATSSWHGPEGASGR